MISYELAKELKEAGFPQDGKDGDWYYNVNGKADFLIAYNYDKWQVKIPTLSELIEACGDRFSSLIVSNSRKTWNAWERKSNCGGEIVVGFTPEEAVARLWLALNKKHATNS